MEKRHEEILGFVSGVRESECAVETNGNDPEVAFLT